MTFTIKDPLENRIVEYRSRKDFNAEAAIKIAKKPKYKHERYTNDAYYDFVTKKELNELQVDGNLPENKLQL